MPNPVSRHISNELYIAAALLVVFGLGLNNANGPSQIVQLGLAAACAAAGYVVRQANPFGRIAGFTAAGATVGYGALCLLSGRGYVTGSIVAVYALVRLFGAESAFSGSPALFPQQQFAAPQQWTPGVHTVSQPWAQPAAYGTPPWQSQPPPPQQPQWQPQAPPPAAPQQWSDAQLEQHYAPPPVQYAPPPAPPAPR
ncbi:MAG: hypothetical protein ABI912_02655 [Actinomycetota bacterium]